MYHYRFHIHVVLISLFICAFGFNIPINTSKCINFPHLPDGEIIELRGRRPPFNVGEKIHFTCKSGYGFGTYISAECQNVDDKVKWVFPKKECKLLDCGPPPEVEFATYAGDIFTFSNAITYTCQLGYEIVGNSSLMCDETGLWEPRYPPFCKALTCPSLSFPKHGYVRDYSRAFGTVASYHCDVGYHLNGNSHRRCQANKTWTGTEPTCIVTPNCLSPIALENGLILNLKDEYKEGDFVIFACNNGIRSSSRCLKNGQWSVRPPLCEDSVGTINSTLLPTVKNTTHISDSNATDSLDDYNDLNSWLIIGVSAGSALVLLCIIACLIFWYYRRRKARFNKKANSSDATYFGELQKLEKHRRF